MRAVQVTHAPVEMHHVLRVLTACPSDIRLPSSKAVAQLRSINLAMSSRGIAALKAIDPGASDRFLHSVIPMKGRMIHDVQGHLDSQLYDRNGQVSLLFCPQLASESMTDSSPFLVSIHGYERHLYSALIP